MLAGDQSPLVIGSEAVGHVAGFAEDAHTGTRAPAVDAVARNVAEQQALLLRVPQRAFGEAEAGSHLLALDGRTHQRGEPRIAYLECHSLPVFLSSATVVPPTYQSS